MKIILITETLHVGGAETFVVRLANALSVNNDVTLINIWPHLSKQAVIDQLSSSVNLVNIHIPFRLLRQKSDALLRKLGLGFSFTDSFIIKSLRGIIEKLKPDVIHTHLFKPDYYIAVLKKSYSFRHVSTCHGDYLLYEENPPAYLTNYIKKRNLIFQQLDTFVVISDDQMRWVARKAKELSFLPPVFKVLNGYMSSAYTAKSRAQLGISENALVYGMVSRGIPEKGWSFLVDAFIRNNLPETYLILIGEGPELIRLKEKYSNKKNIIFVGYAERPIEYIQIFDVGMLTSVYKAESLPTVVIEYLYCGKPVIGTDVGEIRKMITCEDGKLAGDIVACPDFNIDVTQLASFMQLYYSNKTYLTEKAAITHSAFEKFDMNNCVQTYSSLYQKAREVQYENINI